MTTDPIPLALALRNAARIVDLERTNAALTKALLKMQKERDGLQGDRKELDDALALALIGLPR